MRTSSSTRQPKQQRGVSVGGNGAVTSTAPFQQSSSFSSTSSPPLPPPLIVSGPYNAATTSSIARTIAVKNQITNNGAGGGFAFSGGNNNTYNNNGNGVGGVGSSLSLMTASAAGAGATPSNSISGGAVSGGGGSLLLTNPAAFLASAASSSSASSSANVIIAALDDAKALEYEAHQRELEAGGSDDQENNRNYSPTRRGTNYNNNVKNATATTNANKDMDAIRMMERALLLRTNVMAMLTANNAAGAAAVHSFLQSGGGGDETQHGKNNHHNHQNNASPQLNAINAQIQLSIETARAAERLVVKCNAVAVLAFKRDDYNYAMDLLTNAMKLTEPPSTALKVSSLPSPFHLFVSSSASASAILDLNATHNKKRIALRGTTLNNLACLERRRGRLVAALAYIRDAVENSKQQSASSYLNLSAILNEVGNAPEAIQSAKRAISILERNAAAASQHRHQFNSNSSNNTAAAAMAAATEAEDEYTSLIAIAHHNLGTALESVDLTECVRVFEKGLQLAMATVGPDSGTTKAIQRHLDRLGHRVNVVTTVNTPRGGGGGGGGGIGPLFSLPSVGGGAGRSPPPREGGVNIIATTPSSSYHQNPKLRPPGTARDYGVSTPKTLMSTTITGGGGGGFGPSTLGNLSPRPTTSPAMGSGAAAGGGPTMMRFGQLPALSTTTTAAAPSSTMRQINSAGGIGLGGGGLDNSNNNHLGPSGKLLVGLNSADVFASIAEKRQREKEAKAAAATATEKAPTPTVVEDSSNKQKRGASATSSTAAASAPSSAGRRASPTMATAATTSSSSSSRHQARKPPMRPNGQNDNNGSSNTNLGVAEGGVIAGGRGAASKLQHQRNIASLASQITLDEFANQKVAAAMTSGHHGNNNNNISSSMMTSNGEGGGDGEDDDGANSKQRAALLESIDVVSFASSRLAHLLSIEDKFERKYVAARKIQKLVRFRQAQKEAHRRRCARKIAVNHHLAEEDEAARTIQKFARQFLVTVRNRDWVAHQHRMTLAEWHKCALKVQMVAKKWLSRRELNRRREFQQRNSKAIQRLQNWFRKILAIKIAQKMRAIQEELTSNALENERRWKAAVDIQRVWRTAMTAAVTNHARGQRKLAKEREYLQRRHTMAIAIQSMWRAFVAAREGKMKRNYAKNRLLLAAAALEERYAVQMLQGVARGIITRRLITGPMIEAHRAKIKDLNTEKNNRSATIIQCLVRKTFARVEVRNRIAIRKAIMANRLRAAAATLIQSVGQGYVCRRFLGWEVAYERQCAVKAIAAETERKVREIERLRIAEEERLRMEKERIEAEEAARRLEEQAAEQKAQEEAVRSTLTAAMQYAQANASLIEVYEQLAAVEREETQVRQKNVIAEELKAFDENVLRFRVKSLAEAKEKEQKRLDIAMLREKGRIQLEEDEANRKQLGAPIIPLDDQQKQTDDQQQDSAATLSYDDDAAKVKKANFEKQQLSSDAVRSLVHDKALQKSSSIAEVSKAFAYSVGYVSGKYSSSSAITNSDDTTAATTAQQQMLPLDNPRESVLEMDVAPPPSATNNTTASSSSSSRPLLITSARKKMANALNPPTRPVTASRSFFEDNKAAKQSQQNQQGKDGEQGHSRDDHQALPAPLPKPINPKLRDETVATLEEYKFSPQYFEKRRAENNMAALKIQRFVKGVWARRHYSVKHREVLKYIDLLVEKDAFDDYNQHADEDEEYRYRMQQQQQQQNEEQDDRKAAAAITTIPEQPAVPRPPSTTTTTSKVRQFSDDHMTRRFGQQYSALKDAQTAVGGEEAVLKAKAEREREAAIAAEAARVQQEEEAQQKQIQSEKAAERLQGFAKIVAAKKERQRRAIAVAEKRARIMSYEEGEEDENENDSSSSLSSLGRDANQAPPVSKKKPQGSEAMCFDDVILSPLNPSDFVGDEDESRKCEIVSDDSAAEYNPAAVPAAPALHHHRGDSDDEKHAKIAGNATTTAEKNDEDDDVDGQCSRHSSASSAAFQAKFKQMVHNEGAALHHKHTAAAAVVAVAEPCAKYDPAAAPAAPALHHHQSDEEGDNKHVQIVVTTNADETVGGRRSSAAFLAKFKQMVHNEGEALHYAAPCTAEASEYDPTAVPAAPALVADDAMGVSRKNSKNNSPHKPVSRRASFAVEFATVGTSNTNTDDSNADTKNKKIAIAAAVATPNEDLASPSASELSESKRVLKEKYKQFVHGEGEALSYFAADADNDVATTTATTATNVMTAAADNNEKNKKEDTAATTEGISPITISRSFTYDPNAKPQQKPALSRTSSLVGAILRDHGDHDGDGDDKTKNEKRVRVVVAGATSTAVHNAVATTAVSDDDNDDDNEKKSAFDFSNRVKTFEEREAEGEAMVVVRALMNDDDINANDVSSSPTSDETAAIKSSAAEATAAAARTIQKFAKSYAIPSSPSLKKTTKAQREAILAPLRAAKAERLRQLALEANNQEDSIRDIIVENIIFGLKDGDTKNKVLNNNKRTSADSSATVSVGEPEARAPLPRPPAPSTSSSSTTDKVVRHVPKPPPPQIATSSSASASASAMNLRRKSEERINASSAVYLTNDATNAAASSSLDYDSSSTAAGGDNDSNDNNGNDSNHNHNHHDHDTTSDSAASVIQRAYKGHASRRVMAARRQANQQRWDQIRAAEEEAARKIQDGMTKISRAKKIKRELKEKQAEAWEKKRHLAEQEEEEVVKEKDEKNEAEAEEKGSGVSPSTLAVTRQLQQQPRPPSRQEEKHLGRVGSASPSSSLSNSPTQQQQQQQQSQPSTTATQRTMSPFPPPLHPATKQSTITIGTGFSASTPTTAAVTTGKAARPQSRGNIASRGGAVVVFDASVENNNKNTDGARNYTPPTEVATSAVLFTSSSPPHSPNNNTATTNKQRLHSSSSSVAGATVGGSGTALAPAPPAVTSSSNGSTAVLNSQEQRALLGGNWDAVPPPNENDAMLLDEEFGGVPPGGGDDDDDAVGVTMSPISDDEY